MNTPNSNAGSYADIRQIVIDAVNPIKEQLDRIYDSLNKEFYRKDALDPQLKSLQDDILDLKEAHKELQTKVMGTPQKILYTLGAILGVISAIIAVVQHIKF